MVASMIAPVLAMNESGEHDRGGFMPSSKTVDIACVKTAMDARETALMAGWATFNTSITSAYTMRKAALDAAWVMTDANARKTAIKAAWDAFKKSKQAAAKQWRTDQKAAWLAFRTATKTCKAGDVDVGGESMDM